MLNKNIDFKKKQNLTLLFKVLNHFNISDLTANHASALSSDNKSFYINQHKFLFSEILENNLIKVKIDKPKNKDLVKINKAGYFIHKHLHTSKAKPNYILHTHSENAVAISCLRNGFNTKLNQSSMRFYRATEYFEYNGMVVNDTEGGKLSKLVNEKTRLIVLKNHGIIIIAPTIEELFHLTFHFEKCASIQLKIANSREKTNNIRNSIAQKTYNDHNSFGPVGEMSWNAVLRMLNLSKKK